MDEGNVRPHAGQQGDGTVHRVGLTRHCIASGLVQLPFALRDTFPEGELLALDVERDEAVVLEVVPPRGLAGLAEFFESHDLQVNDRLEIRIRGHDVGEVVGEAVGEVRLVAIRSARRPTRSEDRRVGADDRAAEPSRDSAVPPALLPSGSGARDEVASSASLPRPTPLPDTSVQDALEHDGWSTVRSSSAGPDVVETIGSVTVRRLGAGRFAAAATTTLAQPARDLDAEAPSARDARLGVSGRPGADAVAEPGTAATFEKRQRFETQERQVAESFTEPAPPSPEVLGRRDTTVPAEPAEPAEPSEQPKSSERPHVRADESLERPDVRAEAATETPEPADAELGALLVVEDAQTPGSTLGSTLGSALGSMLGSMLGSTASESAQAPTIHGSARQPSLFAPRDAGRPPFVAPARPRSAPDPAASPSAARARPAAVELNVNDLADPEVDAAVRQRAREVELSRAGDLRSRIVRWLLDPTTPVIVPIERVQHAFDLPVEVAREVVEGVLEEPPPSLRLTRLREDLLRVSRVTVEVEEDV